MLARNTENGRISLYFEPKTVPFYGLLREIEVGKPLKKTEYNSYEGMREDIKRLFNFDLPIIEVLRTSAE